MRLIVEWTIAAILVVAAVLFGLKALVIGGAAMVIHHLLS